MPSPFTSIKQEEQLRLLVDDAKYSHLNEDLHVEITVFAPAAEAYLRMSQALFEIKRFLVPVSSAGLRAFIPSLWCENSNIIDPSAAGRLLDHEASLQG